MTSEEYGQYIDDFELGADVMPGESLTEYIERRRREFESKADGGSIGIEVLFREKNKNGGRIGLKDGLMPEDYLYSMDKDAKGFLIGEDSDKIPEGLPEDYLFKIDDEGKIFIVPTKESEDKRKDVEVEDVEDIIERDTPRVGILSGFSPLAFLRKYLAKKELEAKEENKADGGRVGLFMGGPALTGTALDIYNSMKAYGFPDEEIANALRARGLYDTTPAPTAPVQPLQPNITRPNGGGKDENDGPGVKDPYAGLGYSSANFGLGQGINKDAVMDYEADAYSIGRTPLGQLSRFGVGIVQALKNVPTPVNLIRKGIEFAKQKELEKKAREEAIARDAFREAMRQGPSFYDSLRGGKGASVSRASREQAGPGFGDVSESGSFAKGGLATMFTRRR